MNARRILKASAATLGLALTLSATFLPSSTQQDRTQPHSTVSEHVTSTCHEEDPCWNPATMGNHQGSLTQTVHRPAPNVVLPCWVENNDDMPDSTPPYTERICGTPQQEALAQSQPYGAYLYNLDAQSTPDHNRKRVTNR